VTKRRLHDLVRQISPDERLDPESEEFLLAMADDFMTVVIQRACKIAKHRKSDNVCVKDIQLELERNWNLRIPGFPEEHRPMRRPANVTTHAARVHAVARAKK
ncbi:transcription initiation factor TFIID subunit A-domain-containing protein, partial [Blyttiomyces helicus]